MLRLQTAASPEGSSTQPGTGPRLGVWLSLVPPKVHKCSLCSMRFDSLKALGGHQNAHRQQRNEMQKMYMDMVATNQQQAREELCPTPKPPTGERHNFPRQYTVTVANDQEIDLELRLSCGGPLEKVTFYEFMPLKESHGYGAPSGSGHKETYETPKFDPYISHTYNDQSSLFCEPVRAGANAGGAGGYLETSILAASDRA